jgi:hypothetical protein
VVVTVAGMRRKPIRAVIPAHPAIPPTQLIPGIALVIRVRTLAAALHLVSNVIRTARLRARPSRRLPSRTRTFPIDREALGGMSWLHNRLKRGGADSPENMQWQTKEAAKRPSSRGAGFRCRRFGAQSLLRIPERRPPALQVD